MSTGLTIFLVILAFIGFLVFLALVHELGHFAIAKWSGTKVSEFSIGFGPKIIQWKKGDTTYSLRWVLLGGYVSVLSDDVIEAIEEIRLENPTGKELAKIEKSLYGIKVYDDIDPSKSIDKRSYPVKLLFTLAGIFMNFIIAWAALFVGYLVTGKQQTTDMAQFAVNTVSNDASYGFLIEEVTYTVNSDVNVLEGMNDIYYFIADDTFVDGQTATLSLVRNDETWTQDVDMIYDQSQQAWVFTENIDLNGEIFFVKDKSLTEEYLSENHTFVYFDNGWEALGQAFIDAWVIVGAMFVLLADILTLGLVIPEDPWGVAYQGEDSFDINFSYWNLMFVTLSQLLFAFNLIPIAPLDGWKATEYTYEALFDKKVNRDFLQWYTYAGYGFIAVTFIFSFFVGFW